MKPLGLATHAETPAEAGVLVLGELKIPYITKRSTQRKRSYGFVIDCEGRVVFSAPKWVKMAEMLDFAQRRRRFILARLTELEKRQALEARKHKEHTDLKDKYCVLPVVWWREAAREMLSPRVAFWAAKIGVTYGKITITSGKTVWGSCNSMGNISLSWRLLHVSNELREYVIVHELCHRVHMNHGVRFWALVAKHVPDYIEKRRALNKAGGGLE